MCTAYSRTHVFSMHLSLRECFDSYLYTDRPNVNVTCLNVWYETMRVCEQTYVFVCVLCSLCVWVLYIFVCGGPLCRPIVGQYSFVPFGIVGFCKEGKRWWIFRNTFSLQKIPALLNYGLIQAASMLVTSEAFNHLVSGRDWIDD